MSYNIRIVLQCGHSYMHQISPPEVGDYILCAKCRNGSSVIKSERDPGWRLECETCNLKRSFGTARLECERYASKHAVRKRHNVQVFVPGSSKGHRFTGEVPGQLSLLSAYVKSDVEIPGF